MRSIQSLSWSTGKRLEARTQGNKETSQTSATIFLVKKADSFVFVQVDPTACEAYSSEVQNWSKVQPTGKRDFSPNCPKRSLLILIPLIGFPNIVFPATLYVLFQPNGTQGRFPLLSKA